eukprot:GHVQ01019865.1.p1 GENE.GHVQ01019865.1~~GHVQ01019865.1.p1  ORF type:complete len:755 (-),score=96.37 GHVQ01019865.1:138-2402(-)
MDSAPVSLKMSMSQESLDTTATWLCILPPLLGMLCALYEARWVKSIVLDGPMGKAGKNLTDPLYAEHGNNIPAQLAKMKEISGYIAKGATQFLLEEYKYMAVYIVLFSAIIGPFIGWPTMVAFILGSLTSIVCGFIGMKIAVYANVRCTHEAWRDLGSGFTVALRAGSVMGFTLVSLGVLVLTLLVMLYRTESVFGTAMENQKELFEAIAGYGLGGSSIALFGRVGGGIFTKAADVGADLSGKNAYGMAEDDPRNPACIADNVGDNVGDIAGMGADLFGSLAESTCAGLVIAGASTMAAGGAMGLAGSWAGLMFPVMISSTGIVVGVVTMLIINRFFKVHTPQDIEKSLKAVLFVSTILETPTVIFLSWLFLPETFIISSAGEPIHATWWKAALPILCGLWSGMIIGYVTEYYTSHSYTPVREIAQTQVISAATGIIFGMALGYMSCVVPVVCLAITVCVSHIVCGMYGVALAALGMLATLTMGLTIDAYGPISDNAGGIAEMSELGPEVRYRTDAMDAAGNTTAAIGKGFAIGSAALVSLALFGAYTVRADIVFVDILNPWTFTGLLFGAMMPYAFSAMTMKSVGVAANDMVMECLKQFPAIIQGNAQPEYNECIRISTQASLRQMIAPGALVLFSPIVAGMLFGKNCTAGVLAGALVSGVQLAISAANSGGAWDNAKKYIESGALGPDNAKGSQTHKNAVTGDTVGDPLKDTSGPSLNILVKLSAIVSLVFGSLIAEHFSNPQGGPVWLSQY